MDCDPNAVRFLLDLYVLVMVVGSDPISLGLLSNWNVA